jgi:hypothetical protein
MLHFKRGVFSSVCKSYKVHAFNCVSWIIGKVISYCMNYFLIYILILVHNSNILLQLYYYLIFSSFIYWIYTLDPVYILVIYSAFNNQENNTDILIPSTHVCKIVLTFYLRIFLNQFFLFFSKYTFYFPSLGQGRENKKTFTIQNIWFFF